MDKTSAYDIIALFAVIIIVCWYLALSMPATKSHRIFMLTYVSVMTICVILLGIITYIY